MFGSHNHFCTYLFTTVWEIDPGKFKVVCGHTKYQGGDESVRVQVHIPILSPPRIYDID